MEIDLSKLDGVCLRSGSHEDISEGMCVMEAVAYLTGDQFTDFPSCTPREVAIFAQRINDGNWQSDDERTETLVPLIPMLAACERSEAASRIRAFMCADMARLWAAGSFERRGLRSQAESIRSVPPIVDESSAVAAMDLTRPELNRTTAAWCAFDAAAESDAQSAAYAAYSSSCQAGLYAGFVDVKAYADEQKKLRAERIDLLIAMCQVRT